MGKNEEQDQHHNDDNCEVEYLQMESSNITIRFLRNKQRMNREIKGLRKLSFSQKYNFLTKKLFIVHITQKNENNHTVMHSILLIFLQSKNQLNTVEMPPILTSYCVG